MFSVPGKRPRPNTGVIDGARKRGRPMKHASELQRPRSIVNAQLRDHQQRVLSQQPQRSWALSALELLPNELIQHIFFYCLEVNLPRASWHLATALTESSTYRALVLFAFFDDDGIHKVDTRLFRPATYRQLVLEEKIRLQSDILKCRWCDLNFIRSCLPDLARLKMVQKWYEEELAESKLKLKFGDEMVLAVAAKIPVPHFLPDLDDSSQMEKHYLARLRLPKDRKRMRPYENMYLPGIAGWTHTVWDEQGGVVEKSLQPRSSILAARVIPNWLLSGLTSDPDKLELLQLLRQGFQCIDDGLVMQLSATALMQSIVQAIEDHNEEVLITLLELHTTFIRNPLPLHLLHLTARQEAKSSELMFLLLKASPDTIPHDDSVLTAWAIRREAKDQVARWLLVVMSDTGLSRDREIGIQSPFFTSAGFNGRNMSFTEALCYLRGDEARVPRIWRDHSPG